MAQGNFKLKSKPPGRVTKKHKDPKKTARKIIKPKKPAAREEEKLKKQQESKVISSTERLVANRVGHLELVEGAKRQAISKDKSDKK